MTSRTLILSHREGLARNHKEQRQGKEREDLRGSRGEIESRNVQRSQLVALLSRARAEGSTRRLRGEGKIEQPTLCSGGAKGRGRDTAMETGDGEAAGIPSITCAVQWLSRWCQSSMDRPFLLERIASHRPATIWMWQLHSTKSNRTPLTNEEYSKESKGSEI